MPLFNTLLKSIRPTSKPDILRVQQIDEGFQVFWDDDKIDDVYWSNVKRIFTYKVDCFAYDMIWLAFDLRDGKSLHIREEDSGFQELMVEVGRAFPQINPEWYYKVMQPPFAENMTLLFEDKGERLC